MTTLVPGFYGKLPSHGDFVRRRLTGSFVGLWDSWLQNAIARSKDQLGADWLNIYLGSPLWRFVFTPGVCGPLMSAGVLMPSVDRAGRYFPLTMVVDLPDPVNPLPLAAEYDDWFSRAESILLSALDDAEHFELDVFDRQVEECVLDFKSPPRLPAGSEATVFPAHAKSWHIGIASVDHLGASLRHLHWKQLGAHFDPLSLWWTNGSEQIAPSALLCEGIPPAESYAAMLDGNWGARQWPSIHLESVSRSMPATAEMPLMAETPVAGEKPATAVQAPIEPAVSEPALAPDVDEPPLAAEQSPIIPPSQPYIPEFDPMEMTSPRAADNDSPEERHDPADVSVSMHRDDALSGPGPAVEGTPLTDTAENRQQAAPEMDPLRALDVAQRTGTPLDPLEALGLTEATGDDFGVSGIPASAPAAGVAPAQTVAPDMDAASLADPFESSALPMRPSEAEHGIQAQPSAPAAVQSVASGPVFFSASATHAGKQSDFNEDALLERRDVALWAVADGSGGHWIGDVASQAVVSELETVTPSAILGDLADDVKSKLLQAHRYLQENLDRNSDANADSGAAVAVFVTTETMSACLSAGPVRVYRSRNGNLERLTKDSGSQTRLLGHGSELLVDSGFHEVEVGDWFLLCSRGLYEELDDGDIAPVFAGSSPEEACECLMAEALSRGARDNVTIVVVYAASPDEA